MGNFNAAGEGDLDRIFISQTDLVDQYIGESLYVMGLNSYGALGTGNTVNFAVPRTVAGGGVNWKQVSSYNTRHSAGIKTDGTLWTWGDGYYSNTGNTASNSPVTISGGGTTWNFVSAGHNTGAAIKTDGTLWTWGVNNNGQLGTGSTSAASINSPVLVTGGFSDWKYVSAGGPGQNQGAMAGIRADGTMWTWGLQSLLGDWTAAAARSSPAVVVGPAVIEDVSVTGADMLQSSTTSPVVSNAVTKTDKTMSFTAGTYLTVPVSTATAPYGTENFTVECWIYQTTTNTCGYYYVPGVLELWSQNSDTYRVFFNNVNDGFISVNIGYTYNQWMHLAIVRNGSSFVLYINGIARASNTSSTLSLNAPTSSIAYIGYSANGGPANFAGYMDQLRVIKGVAKYTANFTPSLYPTFDPITTDPYYSNVSLLLKADDVANAAQNNTFYDNSPNNLTITRGGNTTQGSFSPFAVEPGKWSGYFDGTGDYLTVPSSSAFAYGTGDFTWEMWVYSTNWTGNNYILDHGSNGGTLSYIGNQLRYYDGAIFDTGVSIPMNTWTHIAATRASGTLRVFINGVGYNGGTRGTNFGTNSVTIANYGGGGSYNFNGYISNVRIVNGTALYTANFTPLTIPLTDINNTVLLTCQNNRFVDNSTNNFTITPAGDVKPVPTSPFSKSTDTLAMRFAGTSSSLSIAGTSQFAIATSTTPFTIEGWIYPTAAGGCIFSDGWTGGSNSIPISISLSSTGGADSTNGNIIAIGWYTGSVWVTAAAANVGLTYNTWTHFATVFTGSTTQIFLNGVDVTKTSSPTPATTWGVTASNGDTWYIGRRWEVSTSPYMVGYLKDFRFVNGSAVYTTNFTPPTAPLKAITNTVLLTCQPDAIDYSTNKLTITKNGAVNLAPIAVASSQPRSLYCPGNGAYWSYASNAAFNFGTGDFTIEAWVYWIPGGSDGPRVMGRNSLSGSGLNGGAGAWEVAYSNTTNPSTTFVFNYQSALGTGSASLGTTYQRVWHHIAIVRTSGVIRTYNNGVLITTDSSANAAGNFDCSLLLTLGHGDGVPWHAYVGNLASVRIVKGTAVYTAAFTPSRTVLSAVSGTSLLAAQSVTGDDQSTNAFTATKNNISTSITIPYNVLDFTTGGSIYFDGTGDYLTVPSNSQFALGTGDFTIEFWAYLSNNTQNGGAFQLSSSSTYLTQSATNQLCVQFYQGYVNFGNNAGFNQGLNDTTCAYVGNTWYHIAMCRQSGTLRYFINGIQKLTNVADTTNYTGTYLGVGRFFDTSYVINGYLSNFRIVTGSAVYTANFTPPTAPVVPVGNTALLLNATNAGIVDSTGRNNLETLGSAQITTNYRKWNTGAISFNGTTDYLTIPIVSGGHLDLRSTPCTVEGWVYFNAFSGDRAIVCDWKTGATSGPSSWVIGVNGNTMYCYVVRPGVNYWDAGTGLSASVTVTTNTWYHFALVGTETTSSFYVNGKLIGSANYAFGGANNTLLGIGANPNFAGSPTGFLNGYIDDLRITKGVARYTKNFSITTKPLAKIGSGGASTSLLTCQSSTIVDNSTNAFTITATGTTSVSTLAPFVGTNSVYLSGSNSCLYLQNNDAFKFGTGDYTVECWFMTPAVSNYGSEAARLISFGTIGTSGNFQIELGTSSFRIHSVNYYPANTYNWVSNQWYHIAVTRQSGTLKVFIDGKIVLTDSTNYTSAINSSSLFGIGAQVSDAGNPSNKFIGYVSNLRIVKGQAVYTSDFTLSDVPFPPLRALPARYAPPDADYSSVTLQMAPVEAINADYSAGWRQVSVGGNHAMAIKTNGTLWGWGQNNRGQLGGIAGGNVPLVYPYGGTWKQVACSGSHSAMIRSDGTLWTCGLNDVGECGTGTTVSITSPITVAGGGTNWKSVTVTQAYLQSDGNTFAVKTDGTLWGWGLGSSGQLAQGNTSNYSSPVRIVSTIQNWKSVTGGRNVLGIAQD